MITDKDNHNRDARATILEGVNFAPNSASSWQNQELIQNLARHGQVAYRVSYGSPKEEANPPGPSEQRITVRRRTRLRSAKLLDLGGEFLCEGLIRDRSSSGLRLQLMRDVRLPARLLIWDDESQEAMGARLAWRRGVMLGVQFTKKEAASRLSPAIRSALGGRFYAMR